MPRKDFLFRSYSIARCLLALLALGILLACEWQCLAQPGADSSKTLSSAEVDRIVRAFTTKEGQFRRALNSYVFKRDALAQSLGMGGQITGEYHRVSFFTFDEQGNRYEKI